MANEIKLKKWNGSAWVQQYPEVRHTDIVASGTPSSSTFLNGDGQWAVPSGVDSYVNITGDTMTGNLTIDSASFASLTLDRESTTSSSIVQFTNNGGVVGGIGGFGNDGLQFRTTDGTQMVLDASNNVGIGNTAPTQKLDVTGNIRASSNMYAARYYDLNNTSYYVDPTSTSILYNIDVQNIFTTRGAVVIDTDTNQKKLYISRTGSTSNEYTAMGRDDTITHIHTKNDESSATVRFRIENTDTESGGGANANDRNIDLISDATSARILIAGNKVATENYVDTEIASLVASAPSTLDTLNELAAALGDDANFSTTMTNSLAGKLNLTGGTLTGTLTSRAIAMQNYNLTGVNMLQFNDPGPNEGIDWSGGNFKIYESPDDLTTNSAGNLQFVTGGTRRMTIGNDGYLYVSSTVQTPQLQTTANQNRTKLRVWSGGTYGIGMHSGFTFGGLGSTGGEYAMTFQMNDDDDRGFWWGDSVHTTAQGAMALTTAGQLTIADKIRVGYGQLDTTTPSTYAVDANGDILISDSNPVLQLKDTDTSGSAYIDYQGGTSLKLHAGADPIVFIAGNSEKARLTAGNGYLGIGTTNPSHGLDVHTGSIRALSNTSAKIWSENTTSGQASLELKSTTTHLRLIGQLGGFQLYDQIDGASRFEIDTNGNSKIFGNLTVQSTYPRIYLTDTDSNSDFSILNGSGTFGIYDDTNSAFRMQINSSGHTTFHKKVVIDTGDSSNDALYIKGTTPTITFADDTSGADDFFIHVNSNNFYVLTDRDGNNNVGAGYETPHPLQLEADTNIGYLFGERIATRNYVDTEVAGAGGGVTSIRNFTNYVASNGTTARQLALTKSLSVGDKIGLVVQSGSTSNYGTRSQEIIWVEVGTSSHTVQSSYYSTATTTARWYAFEVYITSAGALYIDDAVAWTNGSFGHSGSNSSAIYILDVLELT